jgi:hypothetical protein
MTVYNMRGSVCVRAEEEKSTNTKFLAMFQILTSFGGLISTCERDRELCCVFYTYIHIPTVCTNCTTVLYLFSLYAVGSLAWAQCGHLDIRGPRVGI